MSVLDTFVPPRPNRALIGLMTAFARVFMLQGIPVLRDVWPLNKIPPFRGVANIRYLDFPSEDEARLKAVCGTGKATFITPNHPEFFTDWMIDKEVIARVSPLAASWATHAVINGMGRLAQKFWLANNLIAQIPGNTAPAREYSEAWAVKGNGVLLHPEGGVGWHGNFVAQLLPGAVEMALASLEQGRAGEPGFQAWVASAVWKLVFVGDVERALHKECAYVERRLKLAGNASGLTLPARIHRIYELLLARDEETFALRADPSAPFADRQAAVIAAASSQLAGALEVAQSGDVEQLLRTARRKLRDDAGLDAETASRLKSLTNSLSRLLRLGPFAFTAETVTQEELAEHLKRIRNDYCNRSLRDTLNRFVPQPAGQRRAIVRVPEPIGLHQFRGSPDQALKLLRSRMQGAIDAINGEPEQRARRRYPNPFFASVGASVAAPNTIQR